MRFTLIVLAFALGGTAIVGLLGYVLDRSGANREPPKAQTR
jgi:hypothetical protein